MAFADGILGIFGILGMPSGLMEMLLHNQSLPVEVKAMVLFFPAFNVICLVTVLYVSVNGRSMAVLVPLTTRLAMRYLLRDWHTR